MYCADPRKRMEGEKVLSKDKNRLPRIQRQLQLYDHVCRYKIAQFGDICEIFPYNKRLLQRDLADLRDAGLVAVKYSKKARGYIKTGVSAFEQEAPPRRKAYLVRLNRIGRLMAELKNEDIPQGDKKENQENGEEREYFTAKDSYNQLFPGLSERTRQRDFEVLRSIGYWVRYDAQEHYFDQEEFAFAWSNPPEKIDKDYLEGN